MRNTKNFKKLSREEMKNISGGKTVADCLGDCETSSSTNCHYMEGGGGGPYGGSYESCYYSYLVSCQAGCVGILAY